MKEKKKLLNYYYKLMLDTLSIGLGTLREFVRPTYFFFFFSSCRLFLPRRIREIRSNARLDVDIGHLAVAQLIVDVQLGWGVAVHEILFAMYLAQIMYGTECAATALEGFAKGRAKLAVEVCVDEWIKGAVEVAYPEHDRHHHIAAFARDA